MLGVTLFGLFLTPVFYVVVQGVAERLSRRRSNAADPAVAAAAEGH
jgi:gold/copper resistance efflux pump